MGITNQGQNEKVEMGSATFSGPPNAPEHLFNATLLNHPIDPRIVTKRNTLLLRRLW